MFSFSRTIDRKTLSLITILRMSNRSSKTLTEEEYIKFSRYKVSAGHNLFTSVSFGLPNELCGRGLLENFTKKLRTQTAQLYQFLYSKLNQR